MKENDDPRQINIDSFPKASSLKDKIKFLLNFAVLAPSTHNTQPWLFKIKNSDCEISYNSKLLLPEADAKERDLHISMGCCIENLILAAQYFNMFESIDYGPFEIKEKIAVIHFKEVSLEQNKNYKKLIETIISRRNARGIFLEEKVPEEIFNSALKLANEYSTNGIHVHWIKEKGKISQLASLTAKGLQSAYHRSSFRKEMSKWMNNNLTRKKEGMPGYALKMPLILSFLLPTMVRWFNIGNFLAKKNYQSINSAPLLAVITAQDSNPDIWIKVGRLAERLMLEFNSKKWQTSIFVASVEMGELYKEVQEVINTDEIPQFLFVVGRIDSLHKLTPRHKLSKKIISTT